MAKPQMAIGCPHKGAVSSVPQGASALPVVRDAFPWISGVVGVVGVLPTPPQPGFWILPQIAARQAGASGGGRHTPG